MHPNNKSVLMNKLKVEVSLCDIESDAVLTDGGRMLHKTHSPNNRLVKDLIDGAE